MTRIPVILDTDIGTDIDDTWALGLLLQCPELDLKLVTTVSDDTEYRAKIVAKFLQNADFSHIPIGIGPASKPNASGPQAAWIFDYDLKTYPGRIHRDGIQAMIDEIMQSPALVTIIAIGPLTNVALALEKEPKIATKARFIGMQGSIHLGYGGSRKISPEYNVVRDIPAARKVFATNWPMTITPLDTCGIIKLEGDRFQKLRSGTNPIIEQIIVNHEIWGWARSGLNIETETSILFDTVAIYLAISEELVEIETNAIEIKKDGKMKIKAKGIPVRCAIRWKNFTLYLDWLVDRLLGKK
jgi:inosine-uridine nucleoside N-ribohydrolase